MWKDFLFINFVSHCLTKASCKYLQKLTAFQQQLEPVLTLLQIVFPPQKVKNKSEV